MSVWIFSGPKPAVLPVPFSAILQEVMVVVLQCYSCFWSAFAIDSTNDILLQPRFPTRSHYEFQTVISASHEKSRASTTKHISQEGTNLC